MIDSLIDNDVKYTFRFMQCTGRGALTDDQTGALMVHMLSFTPACSKQSAMI